MTDKELLDIAIDQLRGNCWACKNGEIPGWNYGLAKRDERARKCPHMLNAKPEPIACAVEISDCEHWEWSHYELLGNTEELRPLTIEQLKQIEGKPVYRYHKHDGVGTEYGAWAIIDHADDVSISFRGYHPSIRVEQIEDGTETFYPREPEGE